MLAVGKEGLRVLATRLPREGEQTESGAQQLGAPGEKASDDTGRGPKAYHGRRLQAAP